MWIELVPAAVAPKSFQTHQGFVARSRPELAGAFEPALFWPVARSSLVFPQLSRSRISQAPISMTSVKG